MLSLAFRLRGHSKVSEEGPRIVCRLLESFAAYSVGPRGMTGSPTGRVFGGLIAE